VIIAGEDMAQINHFVGKIADHAAAIKALGRVTLYIQKERAERLPNSRNLEELVSDDAILAGVTSSIGTVNEMLVNTQYGLRQLAKVLRNFVDTPGKPKTEDVATAQEDMVSAQYLVNKIAEYVAAIKELERVLSFIQKERTENLPNSRNTEDLVFDDAILAGVTGSIGMLTEMIANAQWCVKQSLKKSSAA
jgi:hypothetical protein